MNIFNKLFKKSKINLDNVIDNVNNSHLFKRYLILIFALFLSSLSFNLFFYSAKIVTGGVSGVSIILDSLMNINPSTFIFVTNIILLIFSYFLLGKEKTFNSIVGALAYPIFVSLTENIVPFIDIGSADMLIKMLFGAILSGTASGLIFKVGFSSGGSDIVVQILSQYSKISIGRASLTFNSIIILISGFIYGWVNVMYAVMALYIMSVITDKVLLGISDNKAFFIITSKEDEIKDFIIDNLKHSVTVLKSHGGFTNKSRNVLMVVVPTKEYFVLKESINEIDKDAFFVVTDSYEVSGGE